jgi:hypothetical protein
MDAAQRRRVAVPQYRSPGRGTGWWRGLTGGGGVAGDRGVPEGVWCGLDNPAASLVLRDRRPPVPRCPGRGDGRLPWPRQTAVVQPTVSAEPWAFA